jgi:cytosine deaminase
MSTIGHASKTYFKTTPGALMDVIIRNANLVDGQQGVDIGIEQGRIAAIGPALPAKAAQEIDAGGDLVSAPFVDAHFHMDATLSYGLPRVNASGTCWKASRCGAS